MSEDKVFLTTKEVAEMLGCSHTYLADARRKGRPAPPAFKINKLVRYRKSEVLAWAAEQEQKLKAQVEESQK